MTGITNLPNLITLGRLLAVPLIVWLMLDGRFGAAFWVFVLAGLSDGLDGLLAKRYAWETALGRYLDPLADKALLMSIYVTLGLQGFVPTWLAVIVVSRDLAIIAGVLLAHTLARPVAIRPLPASKVNTVAQITLAAWLLGHPAFGDLATAGTVTEILVWVVAGTTTLSWMHYMATWLRAMSGAEEGR